MEDTGTLDPEEFDESERISKLSASLKRRLQRAASRRASGKGGRRARQLVLYFVGDSLIRNQYQALCRVLTGTQPSIIHGGIDHCKTEEVYVGYTWRSFLDATAIRRLKDEGWPQPDVVYADAGLHQLHLHPYKEMTYLMFEGHLHFEEWLRRTLKAYRKDAPGAKIEVMTPFPVCEEKFVGSWATVVAEAKEHPGQAARPCVDTWVSLDRREAQAQVVCENTLLTRVGSERIATVIRKVVAELQPSLGSELVDLWNLTDGHCDLCGQDGRHYAPMVLQQLAEFFGVNGW